MANLLTIAATALAVPSPPPAPPFPIVVARPGQPTPVTYGFDVTIRHGDRLLWHGKIAMASNATASLSQRRDETVSCPGADERPARAARFASGFSLSLSPSYEQRDGRSVRLSARLERPADGLLSGLCDHVDTRTVEIQSVFEPEPAKPVTLTGDAGFSVTLTPEILKTR